MEVIARFLTMGAEMEDIIIIVVDGVEILEAAEEMEAAEQVEAAEEVEMGEAVVVVSVPAYDLQGL